MGSMFHFHKKAIIILAAASLSILILAFCIFWMNHVISHKQSGIVPQNFPGTVWKSKDESISLTVPEDVSQRITGTLTADGIEYEIYLSTTAGSGALIMDNQSNILLMKVNCRYSEQQIVMKIKEDRAGIWGKKTIVLYRTE